MTASDKLEEASALASAGRNADALRTLSSIDPDDLDQEERKRLEAGIQYLHESMDAPPSLQRIIANLLEASSDPSLWRNKPQSDGPALYLNWQTVAQLLDRHAPGWQFSVVNIIESEDAFIVTAQIEIAGVKRQASYRHERFGTKREGGKFAYTAPMETAERRAMARAATLFGCGARPPQRSNSNRKRR